MNTPACTSSLNPATASHNWSPFVAAVLSCATPLLAIPEAEASTGAAPKTPWITHIGATTVGNVDSVISRFANPKGFVESLLDANNFKPDRISTTADNSRLFQFNSQRVALVDVYPNGEVIVVVPNGEFDDSYELTVEDSEILVSIMRDAGLQRSM